MRKIRLVCLAAALLTTTNSLFAQSRQLEKIQQIELTRLENGAVAQANIEKLDEERLNKAAEYRNMLRENNKLEKFNAQLEQTIASQKSEAASLKQQILRISNLERDVVPLMSDMLKTLENFIALDVPFLLEERHYRIQNLKALLAEHKVNNSEKYRRILEAYQIENDYGRSIEAYSGIIMLEGQEKNVTFLKIGRIALLYQTLDKSQSFLWSKKSQGWVELEESFNDKLETGIKMAREQIPSNLMFVPIYTPESFNL